jgi:hypothetical protein
MPRWSHGLQETIAIRIWRILLQEVRTEKKGKIQELNRWFLVVFDGFCLRKI